MNKFEKIYIPYLLKNIERSTAQGKRFESSAEHTFSTIILAQYFLKKVKGIDEIKVMRMILYHDLVEIYAGDTFIMDEDLKEDKLKREALAMDKLSEKLPKEIAEDVVESWYEFEAAKSTEAKFSKAIDALDPMIQASKKPGDYKKYGFSEEKLRLLKEHLFYPFPEMHKFFNELIEYLKQKEIIP